MEMKGLDNRIIQDPRPGTAESRIQRKEKKRKRWKDSEIWVAMKGYSRGDQEEKNKEKSHGLFGFMWDFYCSLSSIILQAVRLWAPEKSPALFGFNAFKTLCFFLTLVPRESREFAEPLPFVFLAWGLKFITLYCGALPHRTVIPRPVPFGFKGNYGGHDWQNVNKRPLPYEEEGDDFSSHLSLSFQIREILCGKCALRIMRPFMFGKHLHNSRKHSSSLCVLFF